MSISSINGVGAYSAVTAAETESKAAKAAETTDKQVKEDAAVFEKSQDTKKDSANQIYNRDSIIRSALLVSPPERAIAMLTRRSDVCSTPQ